MKYCVTNEQMKLAEQVAAVTDDGFLRLMKNAGKACYDKLSESIGGFHGKKTVILAGNGNNGGDGIVIAKHITENGGDCAIAFPNGFPTSECAEQCCSLYKNYMNVFSCDEQPLEFALQNCDIIIDCVFGTGFHGELDDKLSYLFAYVNSSCKALKISVDVPSGINSNSGEIAENAFSPDITLTLGAVKCGMLIHPCFEHCGNLILLDIGIESFREYTAMFTDSSIMNELPMRSKNSNKGSYGTLLNIAGSESYMGAALLSTKAALRTGAGLTVLATPSSVARAIVSAAPEAVYVQLESDDEGYADAEAVDKLKPWLNKATAITIGCGLGVTDETAELTEYIIKNATCPLILDADGINTICPHINMLKEKKGQLIMTPHPGEFSRMTGMSVKAIQADRINAACTFAKNMNVTLLLKGVNTVIAAPDGRVYINTTGNAGLAKGGSGDVLTGIIGSLLAQGVAPFEACALGAYLHGAAADKLAESFALSSILPSDIVKMLPVVMKL